MALKLMYITNNIQVAKIAESSGVDWVFIDLEVNGKEERQGHLDTVISHHSIEDVKKIKEVLVQSELLVRVNPIFEGSKIEIDKIIESGADIAMLPFFKAKYEVEEFVDIVNGRAKVCLLLETPEAVNNIDSILKVKGVDYIHLGLNDLHLGYGMKFMFELLADGTVEKLCSKIEEKNIPFGFGGIAQIGQGDLPAEYVISEHYRLRSTMAILSRSFCNVSKIVDIEEVKQSFNEGVKKIRDYEFWIKEKDQAYFEKNRSIVKAKISEIRNRKVGL